MVGGGGDGEGVARALVGADFRVFILGEGGGGGEEGRKGMGRRGRGKGSRAETSQERIQSWDGR